jgi:hypothetical protein
VRDGVRADVCTDPECYEEKLTAYRAEQMDKPAHFGATMFDGDWPKGQTNPKGWCLLDQPVGESELNDDGGWTGEKAKRAVDSLLANTGKGYHRSLAFHPATGKPVLLVRTKDARRQLEAAGLVGKKEAPKPATAEKAKTSATATGPAKKHDPSPITVQNEAAQIAGGILAEFVEGNSDFDDLDALAQLGGPDTNVAYQGLALVAGFVGAEFVEHGTEREIAVCRTLGLPESDGPSPTPEVLREKIKDLTPRQMLGVLLRWCGTAALIEGRFGNESGRLADAFLDYAELDRESLESQARQLLAGQPTPVVKKGGKKGVKK